MTAPLGANGSAIRSSGRGPLLGLRRPRNHSACTPTARAGLEFMGPWGQGWVKSFCSRCGSHLFTTNPENPEMVGIRMGALDEDPRIRPGAHQFVSYAAPWAPIPDDGLPRFPERIAPGATPLDSAG